MISASIVTIVVNGTIVSSVAPARIVAGHVVAPLTPVVVRLVTRAAYQPATATIAIERSGTRVVLPVAFVEREMPFVALGPVIRAIGGNAVFDSPTKTLSIVVPSEAPITTPAPFEATTPSVEPTTVFTPAPPPATPRATPTGVPHPRRTAIPATPSQPVLPPGNEPQTRRSSEAGIT